MAVAGYNAARAMHVPVSSSEGSVLHSVVMASRGLVCLVTAKQGGVVAMWGRVRFRSGKASQGVGMVASRWVWRKHSMADYRVDA